MSWVGRHGGPPELADFSMVRAIYDLVFGFVGGDTRRPRSAPARPCSSAERPCSTTRDRSSGR